MQHKERLCNVIVVTKNLFEHRSPDIYTSTHEIHRLIQIQMRRHPFRLTGLPAAIQKDTKGQLSFFRQLLMTKVTTAHWTCMSITLKRTELTTSTDQLQVSRGSVFIRPRGLIPQLNSNTQCKHERQEPKSDRGHELGYPKMG
jgi:hypothetical protein